MKKRAIQKHCISLTTVVELTKIPKIRKNKQNVWTALARYLIFSLSHCCILSKPTRLHGSELGTVVAVTQLRGPLRGLRVQGIVEWDETGNDRGLGGLSEGVLGGGVKLEN